MEDQACTLPAAQGARGQPRRAAGEATKGKARFELTGWEMIEKVVSVSGNSGRIYLPLDWSGKRVKIIRVD